MGNRPKQGRKSVIPLTELFYPCAGGRLHPEQWFPSLDLCEADDRVVLRLEIPGVLGEELRVSLQQNVIRVEGTKREPQFSDDEKIRFICLERGYGPFQKTVELQWVVDPTRATAVLARGVLTLTLPKLVERRGSVFEIPVQSATEE
jgi:HSP20 family protein